MSTILRALQSVQNIIEQTYAHDEDTGERIEDEPGDASGADVIELLCGIEGVVDDAIAEAEQLQQEEQNREPFNIPNVFNSVRNDYQAGTITLSEASAELVASGLASHKPDKEEYAAKVVGDPLRNVAPELLAALHQIVIDTETWEDADRLHWEALNDARALIWKLAQSHSDLSKYGNINPPPTI